MKLSLCTIVKNDGLIIRKMLDSVVGIVDEIVICDTGSTDDTLEVVKEFSDTHPDLLHLVQFEWCDDFSAARNYSLEHATGDWVLVLDADEFLDEQEKQGLRSYLEQTPVDGVFVTQRNYTGSMKDLSSVVDVDVARVFRSKYRYEGSIHEQIVPSINESNGKYDKFSLHLHHVGYTHEYMKLKGKTERNTALLKQQLKTFSARNKMERWFAASNLLAEYGSRNEWGKVASEARLLIEEIKEEKPKERPNFLPRIYKFCINGLIYENRLDDALRMAKESTTAFPKHTDLQIQKAEVHMKRNEFQEAITTLELCREIGDLDFELSEYIEGSGTYTAARAMAMCWLRLGDTMNALEWFVTSFKENTEQQGVIPWITLLANNKDVLDSMERVIRTPQRYNEFVQFYAFAGYDDALQYIEKSESKWGVTQETQRAKFAYEIRHGQNPKTEEPLWLGLYAYEQGNYAEAITFWDKSDGRGQYLKTVCEKTTNLIKWEIANVFMDIMAAKSIKLLTDFGHYLSDLEAYFPMLMNSDLIEGFCSQNFMRMKSQSHEVTEWKAQLAMSSEDDIQTRRLVSRLTLSSGEKSVRGYLIEADFKREKAREIVVKARKTYPQSMMLQYVWYQNFAETTTIQ